MCILKPKSLKGNYLGFPFEKMERKHELNGKNAEWGNKREQMK